MGSPSGSNHNGVLRPLYFLFVLLALLSIHPAAQAKTVPLAEPANGLPLGRYAGYLTETGGRMTLAEAQGLFADGKSEAGATPILNFGLGARPVWVHLAASNPLENSTPRRLTIENPWLDDVEIYIVKDGRVLQAFRLGDSLPHGQRPIRGRFLAVEHGFAPGVTDIFIRAATPDPLMLPIFLQDADGVTARARWHDYSYGFVYGFLVALIAYNTVLYFGIRDRRYLLYALFLSVFMLTNMAYTGHGFEWLWPDRVDVQRWIIPALMVLFCVAGLRFASSFLELRTRLPRTNRLLTGLVVTFLAAFALAFVASAEQLDALRVAFTFVIVFSGTMLALGLWALRARISNARYFLLASLASMSGATITAASVWNLVDFLEWRYRAAEIGMLLDATLLAIALGSQFRATQLQKVRAEIARTELAEANQRLNDSLRDLERLAATDRLTGLWNRRHFEAIAATELERARRYGHDVSLMMLDIDHFKHINDTYGHPLGDDVLVSFAQVCRKSTRDSDSLTRWGGEEFLILMPNTGLPAAADAAGKLGKTVETHTFPRDLHLTVSIGVARWCVGIESLEEWIARADEALYRAKHAGRNRVVVAPAPGAAIPAEGRRQLLQLHWNPRYECGNAEIDGQHRALFRGANELLGMVPDFMTLAGNAPRGNMLKAIDALLQEAAAHFEFEEALLSSWNWPGREAHRAEHLHLLSGAHQLRQHVEQDTPAEAAAKLVNFIAIELIANHLLRSDREYFAHAHAHDAAAVDDLAGESPDPGTVSA